MDGLVYLWGSNGINCSLSSNVQAESMDMYSTPKQLQFIANMGLVVHVVKCARMHTLILTNNGVSCIHYLSLLQILINFLILI